VGRNYGRPYRLQGRASQATDRGHRIQAALLAAMFPMPIEETYLKGEGSSRKTEAQTPQR
jgi:hypothetical protein